MAGKPVVDLALGFVFGLAVAFLQLARELFPVAANDVQVVIGELAPVLLDLALELFLIAFDLIPVHGDPFRI